MFEIFSQPAKSQLNSMKKLYFQADDNYYIEVFIDNEVFKPYDNQIQLGTRLSTPTKNCTVLGWGGTYLWVKYDDKQYIDAFDAKNLKGLQDLGATISSVESDQIRLITVYDKVGSIKINAGKAAFKSFENQIRLGTRLLTPYHTESNQRATAIVLGICVKTGKLCFQLENRQGVINEYFPAIYNLQQLLQQGFEIFPLRLEQIVRNSIIKNESKIIGQTITPTNKPVPENFYNRLQTVFAQNNLIKEAPFAFSVIKYQALTDEISLLRSEITEMKVVQKQLLEQNKQLLEKLNAKENSSHGSEKRQRRLSMF